MKQCRYIAVILCFIIFGSPFARAQDMDSEIAKLTENLAGKISNKHCKKVSVVDFTDLEGNSTEIGKYAADEMTVDLAMKDRDFAILDRAHLASIMAEHKLTSTGLVNPDNAKQLGMLAGVDALIFGKVKQNGDKMGITVQVIATDTGEIIGAARTEIQSVQANQNLSKPLVPNTPSVGNRYGGPNDASNGSGQSPPGLVDDKPQAVKIFGDLEIQIISLKLVQGGQYLLTMTFINKSPQGNIWVALDGDTSCMITDSGGFQYIPNASSISGVRFGNQPKAFFGNQDMSNSRFNPSTQIGANESVPVTLAFRPYGQHPAQPGICNFQTGVFIGHGFDQSYSTVTTKNLMTKLLAQ
jgi:TolB-like protein